MGNAKTKYKTGKRKKHQFQKKLGVKLGFGKPWSDDAVDFRVEFSHCAEDGEESNEQVHWVQCRKFKGEEYKFLRSHWHENSLWDAGETIESKFVCFYVTTYLNAFEQELGINQAFVFPTTKIGNQTIRHPLYHIILTDALRVESNLSTTLAIALKKCIWHSIR